MENESCCSSDGYSEEIKGKGLKLARPRREEGEEEEGQTEGGSKGRSGSYEVIVHSVMKST